MLLENKELCVETHFYNCTVAKHEILKSHGKNPVTSKICNFKKYGKWQLQFWPDGYANSLKSYCIRLISTDRQQLKVFHAKISIFISDGNGQWITVCKDVIQRVSKVIPAVGIICSSKSFLQNYPETLKWDKIYFEIKCCFTAMEICLINERNWITFKLLRRYGVQDAVKHFVRIKAETKELIYCDVDAVIICKRKWYMFWKSKEIYITVHKSKLTEQSHLFAEMLSTSNAITIPSKFSITTIEKVILFCYQGYLNTYEKAVIAFAIKYQMKKLLSKADENFNLKDIKLAGGSCAFSSKISKNCNKESNCEDLRTKNMFNRFFYSFLGAVKALI